MNIFKRLSLFGLYRSKLNSIKKELEIEFNARIDNISRIYTVLNIPTELFEEPYNLRTSDIDLLSRNYISEYRRRISEFLISKGMMELFELYEVRKVDKYSYLLIYGYSLINTRKIANNLIWISIFSLIGLIITVLCFLIFKTFF